MECRRQDTVLATALVLGTLSQVALGARYSASGEQIGFGVPVPSLVLLFTIVALAVRERRLEWPALDPGRRWLLCAVPIGLLGMRVGQAPVAVKELIQWGEILVLAPWVGVWLTRRAPTALAKALALVGILLPLAALAGLTGRMPLGLSAAKYSVYVICAWPFVVLALANRSRWVGWGVVVIGAALVGVTFRHGGPVLVWIGAVGVTWHALGLRHGLRVTVCVGLVAFLFSLLPLGDAGSPWAALRPHHDQDHLKRTVIETAAALRAPLLYPVGGGLGAYKATVNQLKEYGEAVPHPEDQKVPRDGNCQYLVLLVEAGLPAALLALALFLRAALTRPLASVDHGTGADPRDVRRTAAVAAGALLVAACFCVVFSRGLGIWAGVIVGLACALPLPAPVGLRDLVRTWRLPAIAVMVCALGMAALNRGEAEPGGRTVPNRALSAVWGGAGRSHPEPLRVVVLDADGQGTGTLDLQVEAEDALEMSVPLITSLDNQASQRRCLVIPDESGKAEGRALYRVEVPASGEYRLYARVWWQDGCGNSVLFRVGDHSVVLSSELYRKWHVLEAKLPVSVTAGTVAVLLENLEDGIKVDYWGLRALE